MTVKKLLGWEFLVVGIGIILWFSLSRKPQELRAPTVTGPSAVVEVYKTPHSIALRLEVNRGGDTEVHRFTVGQPGFGTAKRVKTGDQIMVADIGTSEFSMGNGSCEHPYYILSGR